VTRSRTFTLGYLGLAAFFALEATVRERGGAASLRADDGDAGTTAGIVRAFVLGPLLPLGMRRLRGPRLPEAIVAAGVPLEVVGLGVRFWSMRTLGSAYTRTLRTDGQQRVVESGPYRLVRHPGYVGTLLTWLGFALTSGSAPAVLAISALFGRVYARRIAAEERLLAGTLAGYADYQRRTWRLIPLVW